MSDHKQNSAFINFKVVVTPSIVKEYFDGLAKVEEAKASKASKGTDYSFILTPLMTIIGNMLMDSFKNSNCSNSPNSSNTSFDVSPKCAKVEVKPEITVEFTNKPTEKSTQTETNKKLCSTVSTILDTIGQSNNVADNMVLTHIKSIIKHCMDGTINDSKTKDDLVDKICVLVLDAMNNDKKVKTVKETTVESTKVESPETVPETKVPETKVDRMDEKEAKVKETKPKRPIYQEGSNMVFDMESMAGAFKSDGGSGGIDIMKMLGPMMEGLMGGMQNMGKTDNMPNFGNTTNKTNTNNTTTTNTTQTTDTTQTTEQILEAMLDECGDEQFYNDTK